MQKCNGFIKPLHYPDMIEHRAAGVQPGRCDDEVTEAPLNPCLRTGLTRPGGYHVSCMPVDVGREAVASKSKPLPPGLPPCQPRLTQLGASCDDEMEAVASKLSTPALAPCSAPTLRARQLWSPLLLTAARLQSRCLSMYSKDTKRPSTSSPSIRQSWSCPRRSTPQSPQKPCTSR